MMMSCLWAAVLVCEKRLCSRVLFPSKRLLLCLLFLHRPLAAACQLLLRGHPPPLAVPSTPVSSQTVACISSLAALTQQWRPTQLRDFLSSAPNFPWSIQPAALDSFPLPRAYFDAVSSTLDWSFTGRERLAPLARPTSFLDPEPSFS